MKILFVNNVAHMYGGTLQCTRDMCAALPDFERRVHSLGGTFGEVAYEAFGPDVQLTSGLNALDAIREFDPDMIVWQNTAANKLPPRMPGCINVYYQHSAARTGKEARERCHRVFCVSKWLARVAGLGEETVLYQPVSVPAKGSYTRGDNRHLRIGRLCTPNDRKWNIQGLLPYYDALSKAFPNEIRFEFVAPQKFHVEIKEFIHGRVDDKCHAPSLEARSLVHTWDMLLYTGDVEESYGRTIKEAQRAGCVPVANPLGGIVEQIEGGAGYLVQTPEDAVTAVSTFRQDESGETVEACVRRGESQGSLAKWREQFLERILS